MSDRALCRRSLRAGSRSFDLAARLLPAAVREDAASLYAFCRAADDAVDEGGGPAALPGVRAALDRAYAGEGESAAERAFAAVVARHAIPRSLPDALLEGFAWDSEGRRFPDTAALIDYAMRVAGSVGVMMALLMGVRARPMLAGAADLGCAMQLTNIARDVGEDARAGRLYLPLNRLAAAGIDPAAFLAAPAADRAIRAVTADLLAEAARFYARADPAIARLPLPCRPAITLARHLYDAIGGTVARHGHDGVSRRAVVPAPRKALAAARAAADLLRPPAACPQPQPAAGFLLERAAFA